MMTKRVKAWIWQSVQMLVVVALSLIAMDALAQTVSLTDLQQAAEGPPEDAAMRMLKGLLGEGFAGINPWAAGGTPSTLIGSLFALFNSIVFAIGAAWIGWLLLSTIAQSAQDGEPLGKGGSALWAPIRIGVGIFGMVPAIGGFSLFQAIMMSAIALGIGAGNLLTKQVVDATSAFKSITPAYVSAAGAPNLSTDVQTAVRGAVLAELCAWGVNDFSGWIRDELGMPAPVLTPRWYETPAEAGYDYGQCGKVSVSRREAAAPRSESSLVGYRVNAVDYKAISAAVHATALTELQNIRRSAYSIAERWYLAKQADGAVEMVPVYAAMYQAANQLEREARDRLNNAIADAVTADSAAIEASTLAAIRNGGWMRLGSYYGVYAEVSSALADAQRAFQISFVPGIELSKILGNPVFLGNIESRALTEFLLVSDRAETSGEKNLLDRVIDAVTPDINDVGHRSLGQSIVNTLIGTVAKDSGGAGLVNPIVAAKNLGDWLMITGQAGIAADKAGEIVPAGRGLKIAAKFAPLIEEAGQLLTVVFYLFVGLGLFLSVFIPMSLFATWFSAILIYLTSILEALIYAQLAAFGHLRAEGDRFVDPGSSAAKFYVYLLNVLFRPAVMVIAFVLASALMTFSGTFLVEAFASAMGAAQGNSTIGLLSIVGYLLLFCVMLFGLVQTCASLVIDIPDRLLGWVGGQAESNRGSPVVGAAAGAAMRGVKGPVGSGASAAVSSVAPATGSK